MFTYEDKLVTKEIEEGNRGINKGYTQRANAIAKRDRDLANVKAETMTDPETGETTTSDTTKEKIIFQVKHKILLIALTRKFKL